MDEPKINSQTLESVEGDYQKPSNIDTVHGDEALKVIAAAGGDDYWTEQEESKLVRRIDWQLLPVLCLVYGVQFYDKAMLVSPIARSADSFVLADISVVPSGEQSMIRRPQH